MHMPCTPTSVLLFAVSAWKCAFQMRRGIQWRCISAGDGSVPRQHCLALHGEVLALCIKQCKGSGQVMVNCVRQVMGLGATSCFSVSGSWRGWEC